MDYSPNDSRNGGPSVPSPRTTTEQDTGAWNFTPPRRDPGSRHANAVSVAGTVIAVAVLAAIVGLTVTEDAPDTGLLVTAGQTASEGRHGLSGGLLPTAKPLPHRKTGEGDGTFLVNKEMKPGKYQAEVPADSPGCRWTILDTVDGRDTAVGMGVGSPGSEFSITVSKSDTKFETSGCGEWEPA